MELDWLRRWLPQSKVLLLDTVVLNSSDGQPSAWFYTSSKTGEVCEKDKGQLTWSKIGRRFAKFANAQRNVAVLLRRDGGRTPVNEAHWKLLVSASDHDRQVLLSDVTGLQVYYHQSSERELWCRADACGRCDGKDVAADVEKQLRETTAILRRRSAFHEATFVRDDRGQLWLSRVQRGETISRTLMQQQQQQQLQSIPSVPRRTRLRPLSEGSVSTKGVVPRITRSAPGAKREPLPSLPQPWDADKQTRRREELGRLSFEPTKTQLSGIKEREAIVLQEETPEEDDEPVDAAHVRELEQQLTAARLQASAAEEEVSKTARRVNELTRTLSETEKRFESAIEEKTREAEHARLEVDAIKARAVATQPPSATRSTSATVAGLLEQLDTRGQELLEAEQKWAEERRTLEAKAARAATSAAIEANAKHEELRSHLEDEQDKAASLGADLETAKAQLSIAETVAGDLRQELEAVRGELREKDERHHLLVQSARAATSLDRASASPEEDHPNEGPKLLKLDDTQVAATEAKMRQLHNKVVFLKSSLAMELEAKRDLETRLDEAWRTLNVEREEHERRVKEAEECREAAVAAVEERAAAAIEEAQSRATHLENKLAQAQAAHADTLHDAGLARRREEAAKADAQREKTAREAAERGAQHDRQALLAMRAQVAAPPEDDAVVNKGGISEATVRRLENEKQYLQAQLTSEAMCKGELQTALNKATEQLEEAQRQGEEAAQRALDAARRLSERADAAERETRALRSEKKANDTALHNQLETLKAAYVKTRDGLRVEQAEHNRTRLARGELISQMSQMRAEQERTEKALVEARERASQDLRAARLAFDEAEASAEETTRRLRQEINIAVSRLQEVRDAEFRARCELDETRKRVGRSGRFGAVIGSRGLYATGGARLRYHGARAFARWTRRTLLLRLADQQREAMVAVRIDAKTSAEAEANAELAAARELSRDATQAAVAALHAQAAQDAQLQLCAERTLSDDRLRAANAAHDAALAEFTTSLDARRRETFDAEAKRQELAAELKRRDAQEAKAKRDAQDRKSVGRRDRLVTLGQAIEALRDRAATISNRVLDATERELAELKRRCGGTVTLDESTTDAVRFATTACEDAHGVWQRAATAWYANETSTVDCGERVDGALDATSAAAAAASAVLTDTEKLLASKKNDVRARAIAESLSLLEQRRIVDARDYEARIEVLADENRRADEMIDELRDTIAAGEAAGRAAREVMARDRAQLADARLETVELRAEHAAAMEHAADRESAAVAATSATLLAKRHEEVRLIGLKADAVMAAEAVSRALAAEQTRFEEERWRGYLRDAEVRADERQATAWRAGMEERDRIAKREAAELRTAAENAVSEVKASAAASLSAVRVDTKRALDKAATAALERERGAVTDAEERTRRHERRRHDDEMAAERAASDAALRLAVATTTASEQAIRFNQKAQHDRKEALISRECAKLRSDAAEHERMIAGERQRLETARQDKIISVERAIATARAEATAEKRTLELRAESAEAGRVAAAAAAVNKVMRDAVEAADMQREAAVADVEHRSHEALFAAVAPLRLELSAVDAARAACQAMLAASELATRRRSDEVVDARAELATTRRKDALAKLALVVSARRTLAELEETRARELGGHRDEMDRVQKRAAREARTAQHVRRQLETQLSKCDAWRLRMRETLVNHERATLVAHKRRSTELGSDLADIVKDRDAAEAERDKLLDCIDEMQHSVRSLEGSIREHAKASSISADGRINVAHAKKKRRMDDEHDALLSSIETQRGTLATLDARVAKLNDDREAKEDEMKALERRLVELLVIQQKKLLAILQEAASANRTIQEDLEPDSGHPAAGR